MVTWLRKNVTKNQMLTHQTSLASIAKLPVTAPWLSHPKVIRSPRFSRGQERNTSREESEVASASLGVRAPLLNCRLVECGGYSPPLRRESRATNPKHPTHLAASGRIPEL